MKRFSVVVLSGFVLAATAFAGQASASPVCATAPASSPPVYVDLNNDGNPEYYLGSVQNPTVCVDVNVVTFLAIPQAGLCGTGCVYVKVQLPPAAPNAAGYVSVSYSYDGSPYSLTIPFDTDITYQGGDDICVKIGGTGPC
jgi:hypothetical protein